MQWYRLIKSRLSPDTWERNLWTKILKKKWFYRNVKNEGFRKSYGSRGFPPAQCETSHKLSRNARLICWVFLSLEILTCIFSTLPSSVPMMTVFWPAHASLNCFKMFPRYLNLTNSPMVFDSWYEFIHILLSFFNILIYWVCGWNRQLSLLDVSPDHFLGLIYRFRQCYIHLWELSKLSCPVCTRKTFTSLHSTQNACTIQLIYVYLCLLMFPAKVLHLTDSALSSQVNYI